MAEVNWGLLAQGAGGDIADYMQRGRQLDNQVAVAKTAALKQKMEADTLMRNREIAQRAAEKYRAGDFQGATADMISGGSADLINAANTAGKTGYEQRLTGTQGISYIANEVAKLPYEARAAAIRASAPLLTHMGASIQDIEGIAADPNDASLAAVSKLFYSTEKQDGNDRQVETNLTNQQNAVTGTMNAETSRMAEMRAQNTPVGINPENNVYLPGGATGTIGQSGGDYNSYMVNLESSGNPNARAGTSSASGLHQFTDATWLNTVRQAKPAWAAGLSKDQLLAARFDPAKSTEMADVLTSTNSRALVARNLPATNENLYALHHFGAGSGLRFASAPGNTPVSQLLTPQQIDANPYVRGKTKDEVVQNWNSRNQNAGVSQPRGPQQIAQGRPQNATRMSDAEVANERLDPNQTWYRNKDGMPVSVNKQTGARKNPANDIATAEGAVAQFDGALRTANNVLNHPGLSARVGVKGLTGGLLGGWVVPGTDAANFEAQLTTFKAKTFLPMVQSLKGMGALSDAEGKKLTDAVGALDINQGEEAFKREFTQIIVDLKSAKARAVQALNRQRSSGNSNTGGNTGRGAPAPGTTVVRNGVKYTWTGSTWTR